MKIALGQMKVVAGKCQQNFDEMQKMIQQAKEQGVDLIVFPELCVGGYYLMDHYFDKAFCYTLNSFNERILGLSEGIGIVYGNIYTSSNDEPNKRSKVYDAAYCVYDKELIGFSIKNELNSDELRYFDDKEVNKIVEFKEVKFGLTLGNDPLIPYVDFNVKIDSTPFTYNEVRKEYANTIYVNPVGMQNNGKVVFVYEGNSAYFDKEGKAISANDDFKEELKIFTLGDKEEIKVNDHKLLSALLCGIKEFDKQMFNSSLKWIIGLSGGLDSTVDACLLTMALGKDRVVGYNMASRYNSDKTKNNARHLANALGIEIREGSIEKITKATCTTLEEYGYEDVDSGLAYENIQARIRGHLLSSFAAKEGGVIINNGNKVEVCLGYCTLYGDSVGALSPIGDITKVQLFELSHQINKVLGKEAVPYNLLPVITDGKIEWDMAPSAELKDAQRDPMKWFYHDALVTYLTQEPSFRVEDLMESYLDGSIYATDMGQWIKYYGLEDPKAYIDDIHWFLNTMSRNKFKRFQGAPIIRISNGCFGYDYREAQISVDVNERFKALEAKILNG